MDQTNTQDSDFTAKLKETFREEAYELLAELEAALLELEKTPGDEELVGRVFRAMHTIKGSGGTCGLNDVSAFTHDLETAFDLVRKGKLVANHEIINLTLKSRDQIKAMLDRCYKGETVDDAQTEKITAALKKLIVDTGEQVAPAAPTAKKTVISKEGVGRSVTYRIRFRPEYGVFTRGTNPIMLLNELRELGPCKIVAQTEAVPFLEDYNPEACYTYWDVILTTDKGKNAIEDVFIFVKDESELSIDVIDEEGHLEDEASYKRVGDILLERGDLSNEDLQKVLHTKKLVGELLVETGAVNGDKLQSALAEQQHVREIREKRQGIEQNASIRVATGKLDQLVNLVGELVTVQARLSQTAVAKNMPELLSIAEEVERLTAELRDNTMSIRMLPIGTTFSKFERLVRDLSAELGKDITLTTEGAETELDKTVIERLGDPLVHIIRNSIDHGIEQPDVREAAGKPRQGTIHLSALHSGANVLIQIRDDGAGLDKDAIRAKAIEKGLIIADASITEKETFALVLAPGFSTAKKVTSVSGRGVGMDVVKKAIDALRGSIEINSRKGEGTTITLRLPLTLAIIDGFLTKIGMEHFIFPLSMVEECVELTRADAVQSRGRHMAHVRGQIVPYIRLREQFNVGDEQPDIEQIVIIGADGRRVGFVVDGIVGQHQTVLKSLGKFYANVEGVSGATILGDGTVALILDIPKLIQIVEQEELAVS